MTKAEVEKVLKDLKAKRADLLEKHRDLDYRIDRLVESRDQLEADVLATFNTTNVKELENRLVILKQEITDLITEININIKE